MIVSTSKEPILQVVNLKKYFPIKAGVFSRVVSQIRAVDGVSFSIREGETFGLVGESGCGKSTLGRTILKLLEPDEGEVFYKGEEVFKMQPDKLRSLRREVQIIFQDPYGSLNPRMTVGEAIGESLEDHGVARGKERRERVEYLLDVCGLAPYHFRRYPHEFSGGQRQRIGIARALALNPNFIVADEPISALDVSIQAQIINLLEDLQKEFGLTFLFISHDLSMVKHMSDWVAVMYLGVIAEMAPKKDLYHPERKVIYLSAEKFMYQFIRALRFKDTVSFKDQFRSVDVLMIDDVQFISGKDSTQEEFFHTFNALVEQNHQIIVSADKSPSDLEGMEDRLKSRLGWGLVADIHPTTYELRLGILQAKADQLGIQPPQKVLEFLAHKITSNVRELEGALTRVLAHATLVGRDITIETTQEVLRDLLRANDRKATIDDIQKKVCEYYNVRVSEMHSPKRARSIARPRQVAMFLCKMLTPLSLPEIGRKFGGRDHTTVMHAVKKIEELIAQEDSIREDIELLRRMLET